MTETRDPPESGSDGVPLTPAELDELVEALMCAYRPTELAPERHEELLASALEDPFRPADEHEVRESERFRQALEGRASHPDLALARALTEMYAPGQQHDNVDGLNERALERALGGSSAADPSRRAKRSSTVIYVSFGLTASLAAAALVLLFVLPMQTTGTSAPAASMPALTQSRSTAPLFEEKFERDETTSRIDRIAAVRARELRANRFKQWGAP